MPEDLATRVAVLHPAYMLLDIVEIAHRDELDPAEVARVHFALGERLGLPMLVGRSWRCRATTAGRRWPAPRCATTCYAVHAQLTAQVLRATDAGRVRRRRGSPAWEEGDAVVVARAARHAARRSAPTRRGDLARMSVGLRVVRGLLASS